MDEKWLWIGSWCGWKVGVGENCAWISSCFGWEVAVDGRLLAVGEKLL